MCDITRQLTDGESLLIVSNPNIVRLRLASNIAFFVEKVSGVAAWDIEIAPFETGLFLIDLCGARHRQPWARRGTGITHVLHGKLGTWSRRLR